MDVILNYGNNITFDSDQINRKWEFPYNFLYGKIVTTAKYAILAQ